MQIDASPTHTDTQKVSKLQYAKRSTKTKTVVLCEEGSWEKCQRRLPYVAFKLLPEGKKQKAVKLQHTEQKMCKKNEYFLKKSDIRVESITC